MYFHLTIWAPLSAPVLQPYFPFLDFSDPSVLSSSLPHTCLALSLSFHSFSLTPSFLIVFRTLPTPYADHTFSSFYSSPGSSFFPSPSPAVSASSDISLALSMRCCSRFYLISNGFLRVSFFSVLLLFRFLVLSSFLVFEVFRTIRVRSQSS